MAREVIDTTTDHGSYRGDPGKTAWDKANRNFDELYAGMDKALASPVACQLGMSANYSIASGVVQAIPWNTEFFDTASMHATSSNTEQILIVKAGFYLVACNIQCAANANGSRAIRLLKNGSLLAGTLSFFPAINGRATTCNTFSVEQLAAGDIISAAAFQDSGSTIVLEAANCKFSIYKLSV